MLKKILLVSVLLQTAAYGTGKIPEPIKAPEGQQAFLSVHAKGDQIYQCSLNHGKYAWEAKAPDALLFNDHWQVVGKHYSGPIWEYKAGSRVVGRIVKKLDVSDKAIAWLLVEVVEHKGKDFFADAKFINRINTQGGLPPTSGCDGNHLGNEKRVAYEADYVFFKKP